MQVDLENIMGAHMEKAKQVRILQGITVLGCTIACCGTAAVEENYVRALAVFPFTCLSGVCAFMYYRLDKEGKHKVWKPSTFFIRRIAMHPYFFFLCVICINIMCLTI
ncbi:MAG: hypothetical protein IJA20_05950 [Methanocorpusculum sp.]|nr:hypothetical protein [Methanocorpusculum sp.]